jgi:hypothetical protein
MLSFYAISAGKGIKFKRQILQNHVILPGCKNNSIESAETPEMLYFCNKNGNNIMHSKQFVFIIIKDNFYGT